jgi:TolA protein
LEAQRQEAQRQEAQRQEVARAEAARLEAEREERARQAAAEREAQQREAARQDAARVETARLEDERQAAARRAAAELEAQQLELARQEEARAQAAQQAAARAEAQRLEAARLENERQDAARAEAAQQAAARQEAARAKVDPAEARREAVLRAIGRQLDEEADQRDAAAAAVRAPNTLPYSLSTARRVRLWGRIDPNVELVNYAEAWARKIQFNTSVDTVRELAQRPHVPPMVTVAVRSDGSVESVSFVVSSGVAQIDEAVRRIIESQRPYTAFPPVLAREFDVVEIRRTWHFTDALRLY